MAEITAIAWTDATFNPVIGCTKVGPGCDHCYAEQLDIMRFSKTLGGATPAKPIPHWGPGAVRHRTGAENWKQPLLWNRKAEAAGTPTRVFCASMADVFDNEWPAGAREDLFALIDATPWLRWQLLTKRISNAAIYRFPANVWLGITVVTQAEADRDIPKLQEITAAVRFLSIEPQLEPIVPNLVGIDWVICGGESGPHAREFNVEWARALRRQCDDAGVAFFMKQLGAVPRWNGFTSPGQSWPATSIANDTGRGYFRMLLRDRAGADMNEWPEDLRVQQFPDEGGVRVCPQTQLECRDASCAESCFKRRALQHQPME